MTAPPLTLVVLAAGMGSRYGGLKQLERVGPSGETLMDYSVYDAARAGFTRAVFVVRPDIESVFLDFARDRFGHTMEIATALQRLDDLPDGITVPPGRTRPWGTTQAVLAAAPLLEGSFATVNADDFYGRRALDAIAAALRADDDADVLVGYRMRDTMSEAGTVNRAVCDLDVDGWLRGLREIVGVAPTTPGGDLFEGRTPAGELRHFHGDALVSMNAWGFRPSVIPTLRAAFARFLAAAPGPAAECILPESMGAAIRRREARVRVLDARSAWLGITYPQDRPGVAEALAALVAQGTYPSPLWSR